MPQSRRRSGRAALRARYRKPRRRRTGSMGWNVAIAAVIVVGVVAVVLARGGAESGAGSGPPRAANAATGEPGDHWHTALAVNICGEWLPPQPEFEQPVGSRGLNNVGIHSHGDGLIHTHPFTTSESGNNATLGKYAGYGGWNVSSDAIRPWTAPSGDPGKQEWADGDRCTFGDYKGKKGELVWAVDGKTKSGDPAQYHQQDGETIAIGFLPKGVDLEFPPFACAAFANISDQNIPAVVSKDSPCRELSGAPDETTTTAPLGEATTTVPPDQSP